MEEYFNIKKWTGVIDNIFNRKKKKIGSYYGSKHHLDRWGKHLAIFNIYSWKTCSELRLEWNFLNVITILYKNPIENIVPNNTILKT